MDRAAPKDGVMKRWMVAWVAAVGLTAGCAVEERLATSPLIGAEPIEDTGEARVLEVLTASRYAYMRQPRPPLFMLLYGGFRGGWGYKIDPAWSLPR